MQLVGGNLKYDILTGFRVYLESVIDNKNTRDKYYFAVDRLFKKLQFDKLDELNKEQIEKELAKIKGKDKFSAAKNGLKHLRNYDNSFQLPEENFFKEQSQKRRNHSIKGKKTIVYDETLRKINAIRNKKLKLGYRLMLASGLRVFETSQLEKDDIEIKNDKIYITVKHGKSGSNGIVECLKDSYLLKELPAYLKDFADGEKIFYSAKTIKNKANELNIECHNLRRIAAITYKKEQKEEGKTSIEADDNTREFLRHERFATTKRYLYNRNLIYKDKETKFPSVFNYMNDEEKEENLKALNALKEREREIYLQAIENEQEITKEITSIVKAAGGEMKGLEKRIKSPKSVYEKIYERHPRTKIQRIDDIIRYTAVYDIDNLSKCTLENLEEIRKRGYDVMRIKNTWNNEDEMYKGINITIKNPNGQKFELQFHTEESFNLKNNENHEIYEKTRLLPEDSEELIELNKKMITLSNKLHMPPNIGDVK